MLEVAVVCILHLPRLFVLLFFPGNEIKHYSIRIGLSVDFPVQAYRTKKSRDVFIQLRWNYVDSTTAAWAG